MKRDIKLLDCSLRDGGYVNQWIWGFNQARAIIRNLVKSEVDIVEVGFLRNIDEYKPDITVCNYIEELNRLLPSDCRNAMFSAMAMQSNYDICKLSEYNGSGIEMIRVTAHDYDIKEGFEFAKAVRDKGYKLSINPINIMGYSDRAILDIIDRVNDLQPYQFSIVDTFGSMKRRDFDRILSLVDNNLDSRIRLGLHLHENFALSFSLAQSYVDRHIQRPVSIDGSLMGIGRIPGNLPIELIADYINEYADGYYNIDYMMDAIQDYISPIKGDSLWGYTPAYFLSARYNLHRNYSEHFLNKGDLTNRDINHILAHIDASKRTAFDKAYADRLYLEYLNNNIDDTKDLSALKEKLGNKSVLVIVPGRSIIDNAERINSYIDAEKPVVISLNFVPEQFRTDMGFFSNSKRLEMLERSDVSLIATSNLEDARIKYRINYNKISGDFNEGCNSLILILRLLKLLGASGVVLAGADGYSSDGNNYYSSALKSTTIHDKSFNEAVALAIKKIGIAVEFLTPSGYQGY